MTNTPPAGQEKTAMALTGPSTPRTVEQMRQYWIEKLEAHRVSQASTLRHGMPDQSKWHEGQADAIEFFEWDLTAIAADLATLRADKARLEGERNEKARDGHWGDCSIYKANPETGGQSRICDCGYFRCAISRAGVNNDMWSKWADHRIALEAAMHAGQLRNENVKLRAENQALKNTRDSDFISVGRLLFFIHSKAGLGVPRYIAMDSGGYKQIGWRFFWRVRQARAALEKEAE